MNHFRLIVFNSVTKLQIIFFITGSFRVKKSLLFHRNRVICRFLDLHQPLSAIRRVVSGRLQMAHRA